MAQMKQTFSDSFSSLSASADSTRSKSRTFFGNLDGPIRQNKVTSSNDKETKMGASTHNICFWETEILQRFFLEILLRREAALLNAEESPSGARELLALKALIRPVNLASSVS